MDLRAALFGHRHTTVDSDAASGWRPRRRLWGRIGAGLLLGLVGVTTSTAQFGLKAGTVSAQVDGAPFSASVSIATFSKGKLVLTSFANSVQLQIPQAKVARFDIEMDEDGRQKGVVLGLKVGKTYMKASSGAVVIESLSASRATGSFECEAIDLATEKKVKVTKGRFDVKLTGK